MLCLRTGALEDEVVPVEVAEVNIRVCSCLVRNHPWTLRILSNIVATVLHHLDLIICECPCAITLEVVVELVTEGNMIV